MSRPDPQELKDRVREVRERIDAAARRAGRDSASVTLIGASKTVAPDLIRAALAAGVEIFGENRVQEAEQKIPAAGGGRWHLIGRLQRNKARRAVELFELIQSLDSVRLAEVLDRLGQERGRPIDALLEVNLGGEASKGGFDPAELSSALDTLAGRPGLRILGLMTVPPFFEAPELSRPFFRRLRELAHEFSGRGLPGASFAHLSMGMSGDYEVAVEEGASLVRVGTALFGPRL